MSDVNCLFEQNCTEGDPPCPVILVERFGFEMKKSYRETQLQVLLSPAILLTSDKVLRPSKESHLTQGHLTLSGFQVSTLSAIQCQEVPVLYVVMYADRTAVYVVPLGGFLNKCKCMIC
jgi:hypothetical protein